MYWPILVALTISGLIGFTVGVLLTDRDIKTKLSKMIIDISWVVLPKTYPGFYRKQTPGGEVFITTEHRFKRELPWQKR